MYRIILCLILSTLSMPSSFAITSCLSFSVISKSCRVELQQRQQGQIQVQQNFIKEECVSALDLCESWANENEVEGKCQVNNNQEQFDTTIGCIGQCTQLHNWDCNSSASRCPSKEQYCGNSPRIGDSVEELMRYRKCVRKVEACENGEIEITSIFN